ncbi:MAG: glycosyltransferase family 2 protein [Planctomycetota bacterium]
MDLSIVVPIFNEAGALPELLRQLYAVLSPLQRPFEIFLINDGSTDDSPDLLDQLASEHPEVRVLHFTRNFGQTAALMAGIDYASGEIIVCMDGDLQNDPADIPRLLAKLDEGYDVVSGWRHDRQDNPLRRKLPSHLANRLIAWLSGVELHDFGCTLKAYRRSILQQVRLYGEMHRFIPVYAHWNGAAVAELPVTHHARSTGQAKYGLERVFKVLLDLILLKFLEGYASRPIHLFGGIGFLSLFASFCCALAAVYYKLLGGKSFIETPLPTLMAFTGLVGVLCIFMGLLAELQMRTYYESQGKPAYLIRRTVNVPD